jgi:hypothetical protein
MRLLDSGNNIHTIESINKNTELSLNDNFVYDLSISDVVLKPILALEELTSPAFECELLGDRFFVPANFYTLIYSPETSQVDTVKFIDIVSNNANIVIGGWKYGNNVDDYSVKIVDFTQSKTFIMPLNCKQHLTCLPFNDSNDNTVKWIYTTPYDVYNRYLKNSLLGDFL